MNDDIYDIYRETKALIEWADRYANDLSEADKTFISDMRLGITILESRKSEYKERWDKEIG